MAVTQTTDIPTYTPPDQFQPVGKKELNRDDFMKLFITQLQYQDPTKPMDSYEVASQLAQFSSLEATMKMSDSMDNLLAYQVSQNNLQLMNLLDADVRALGNAMSVENGEAKPTEFVLQQPVSSCFVKIYDADGNFLQQLDLGSLEAGTQELAWDGKDLTGRQVADGMYNYEVEATTLLGDKADVESHMTGTVTGLQFDGGKARITLDNQIPVEVGDVISVLNNQN